MIQVEVEKNLICLEDICFGTGSIVQSRGGSNITLTKINASNLPYDADETLQEHMNVVDAQYNYIIANLSDGFEYSTLVRNDNGNFIDTEDNVIIINVPSTASSAEATYTTSLWVKEITGSEHHLKRGTDVIAKFNPVTNSPIIELDYAEVADLVLPELGLGTAAALDAGTAAGEVLLLDENDKLPALDGSLLTNLPIPEVISVPVGGIIMWSTTTPPDNYLMCDGSAISRTTYATLFAVIGTSFGLGDGSTTFQLPETRAEFVRGLDLGRGIDTGRVIGSAQLDAMQGHTHITAINQNFGGSGIPALEDGSSTSLRNYTSGGPATDGTNGTPRIAAETRGRNVAFPYIIRYQ